MLKNILPFLLIIGSCITLACSNPDYNDDYEQGYEKGYSIGYNEGYNEGYNSKNAIDTTVIYEYLTTDEGKIFLNSYLNDEGIITLNAIYDELPEIDYKKITSILDDYFAEEYLLIGKETHNNASNSLYGYDFESTWGDLIDANGGELVYETLTPEQQALVNYPYFNKENVYFVPNGSNYHSVDWCYTLEKSREIINCTLQDALNKRLNPCSKCVGE